VEAQTILIPFIDMTMGESLHPKVALRRLPLNVTVIEPNLTMGIVWTL
jgi:hypothetical protein